MPDRCRFQVIEFFIFSTRNAMGYDELGSGTGGTAGPPCCNRSANHSAARAQHREKGDELTFDRTSIKVKSFSQRQAGVAL